MWKVSGPWQTFAVLHLPVSACPNYNAQVCASQAENLQLRGALHVAKQAAEPSVVQLRQLLLDPAVNREFAGLRAELEARTRELALAQAAVRFGGHGEPLLAKLDKLQVGAHQLYARQVCLFANEPVLLAMKLQVWRWVDLCVPVT